MGVVTKQACDAKPLEATTTKFFEHPEKIVNDAEVSFYCTVEDCNVDQAIKDVLKKDVPETIAAMKAVGSAVKPNPKGDGGADGGDGGADGGDGGADGDNKGQLISKFLLLVIILTKKPTNFLKDICPSL